MGTVVTTTEPVLNRDRTLLHPKAQPAFFRLLDELIAAKQTGATEAEFKLFEGFRSPLRQDHLRKRGTSKAAAWQSAHQYGLAVDVVPYVKGQPTWVLANIGPHDLEYFDAAVKRAGLLRPILWDPYHVEHPLWNEIRKLVL